MLYPTELRARASIVASRATRERAIASERGGAPASGCPGLTSAGHIAYIVSTLPKDTAALGELETLLLLAVLHLTERHEDAYGSAIREAVEARTPRHVPRGSLYITLDRLEEKGLLASRNAGTSAARGHRPKRVFKVTAAGVAAVRAAVSAVARMRRGLEDVLGEV